MSVETPQDTLSGFFKSDSCEDDKMSQAATENCEIDGENECLEEPGLLSSTETLTVVQLPTDESWEEQCELNSDQMQMLLLKTSLLNGYNIDEDVKGAIESGNIKEYCRELVPKLTEYAQNRGSKVIEVVVRLKDQAFALVREEVQRNRSDQSKHGDTEQERFQEKLESLPKSSNRLVREALSNPDPELFCNRMGNEIQKTVAAMHAQAKIDAKRVAREVSKVAKAKRKESKLAEKKNSMVDEGEKRLEKISDEKDLLDLETSDSNTSGLQADEDSNTSSLQVSDEDSNISSLPADKEETYLEAEDLEPVKNESNTASSQASDDKKTAINSEEVEKDVTNRESDEDSEKPAIATDDEHVIPTPEPPPPQAEDLEPVKTESNTASSQASEVKKTAINSEEVEKHVTNRESDEDSEKPAIGTDDDHVIPTPPPPPPQVSQIHNAKVDEIQEKNLELKKYQVNQLRKELSFAMARLTSEVIKSYEQACILQKHGPPSLEKSTLDFMEKQETKKTFYIKEISTRVDKIIKMLSPQSEMNTELQDLDETVKLLHFLQSTRNYYVDKVAVSTNTNSFMFNILPPLAFLATVITLSLNGEWIGLIVFLAIILICLIKSWHGANSTCKKRVEVFARKKKAEKID